MKITPTQIPDVLVIEPTVHCDDRGYLFENFNRRAFADATGQTLEIVQENYSRSVRNVLRGLHYQVGRPQGKLVQVTHGEVFDVAVDLRRSSPTFGHWIATNLSAANKRQCWIPAGFAHGFYVTSDYADVSYKMTEYWHPGHERIIRWDDADLAVAWPLRGRAVLSDKDLAGIPFTQAELLE